MNQNEYLANQTEITDQEQPFVLPDSEHREDLSGFVGRLVHETQQLGVPVEGVFNQTHVIAEPSSTEKDVHIKWGEAREPLDTEQIGHISTFADRLIEKAKRSGHPISGTFNGVTIQGSPDSVPDEIASLYFTELENRRVASRK